MSYCSTAWVPPSGGCALGEIGLDGYRVGTYANGASAWATCGCITNERREGVCQARFKDAAGLKEHACSRRADHEQVGHISDTCGATDQLKVIECNNWTGTLVVDCPHCNRWRVEPGMGTSVDVAMGETRVVVCHGYRSLFDLNRNAIANCLHETNLVRHEIPPRPEG